MGLMLNKYCYDSVIRYFVWNAWKVLCKGKRIWLYSVPNRLHRPSVLICIMVLTMALMMMMTMTVTRCLVGC